MHYFIRVIAKNKYYMKKQISAIFMKHLLFFYGFVKLRANQSEIFAMNTPGVQIIIIMKYKACKNCAISFFKCAF